MNLKDALKIIKNKEPKLIPLSGLEFDDYFAFNLTDENEGGNSQTYIVYKNNSKTEWISMFDKRVDILNAIGIIETTDIERALR